MSETMSAVETELRLGLDNAVTRLRSALDKYPARVEDLDAGDTYAAAALIGEARHALDAGRTCSQSLARLTDASREAVCLATSSRLALAIVAEVLALLSAELDGYGET